MTNINQTIINPQSSTAMIIHGSNNLRYDINKALIPGTWDIIAKNKTRCWTSLSHKIVTTDDKNKINCKKCLKLTN